MLKTSGIQVFGTYLNHKPLLIFCDLNCRFFIYYYTLTSINLYFIIFLLVIITIKKKLSKALGTPREFSRQFKTTHTLQTDIVRYIPHQVPPRSGDLVRSSRG
jgi:hypothetical protein